MVRVGFVGAGVIAWAHSLGLQAMAASGVVDVTFSVVHDVDEQRASGLASFLGATAVPTLGEALERCDAVWVCTPTAHHGAAVEEALAHGRAIFCEKPLAPDLAGARSLAAAVSAGGVPAQVGLVLRSTPVFRSLRDLVQSEELGRPMSVVFRDDQYFPVQGVYGSTWRSDVSLAGGGCLIEHSIHDLDILQFCLGTVVEVAGRTANFSGYDGVEDVASVHLEFASGASATLVSVWHSILSRGSTRRVEVFCERGLAWFDDAYLGPLHVETGAGAEVCACPPPAWVSALPLEFDEVGLALRMYVEADRAFIEALEKGRPPTPDFADALGAHRLVDAAYRSADSGTVSLLG